MSLIVAGRFDTFAAAEQACQRLFKSGFKEEEVTLFFVNPRGQHDRFLTGGDRNVDPDTKPAHKGAGIGIAVGSMLGAMFGVSLLAIFHLPLLVTIISAGVGAYVGSLIGAMAKTRTPSPYEKPTVHDSGILVAVHVNPDNQSTAATILRQANAKDIERAHGRWRQGQWRDFDPLKPPTLPKDL